MRVAADSVAQDQLRAFVERMEQEALLDLYLTALGMAAGPELAE